MKIKILIFLVTSIFIKNNCSEFYGQISFAKNLCCKNIECKSKITKLKNNIFGFNFDYHDTNHESENILIYTVITISNTYDPNYKDEYETWVSVGWNYIPISVFQNNDKTFKKENDEVRLCVKNKNKTIYLNLKLGKSFKNLKEQYEKFITKNSCNIL